MVPTRAHRGAASRARRLLNVLKGEFSGIPLVPAVASVVAMCSLIVTRYQGSPRYFSAHLAEWFEGARFAGVYPYSYWALSALLFYICLPLAAAALTPGQRVRDTGLGLGDAKTGLLLSGLVLALFLPIVALAAKLPDFSNYYPHCSAAKESWSAFMLYEAGQALYFIGWEYLFRGYLLFSLERSMGKLANFVQMMPFVIVHWGKPELETFGSIIAGLALGMLALRTRSCWYGALIHIVVALTMDLLTAWGALAQ